MRQLFYYKMQSKFFTKFVRFFTQNTTKFGKKSLMAFGTNIWNTLPEYSKSTTSLLDFKKFIKTWPGPKYKCSVCK